jgi:hypothetical protein
LDRSGDGSEGIGDRNKRQSFDRIFVVKILMQ